MHQYKFSIPHCYHWMAGGDGKLFKRYVVGYVKRNHIGYELVRIEDKGRIAVIRKKA